MVKYKHIKTTKNGLQSQKITENPSYGRKKIFQDFKIVTQNMDLDDQSDLSYSQRNVISKFELN
jgi:hypothetical protein